MSTICARLEAGVGPRQDSVRILLTREQFRLLVQMREATIEQWDMVPGTNMVMRWLVVMFESDINTRGELDVR